MKKPQTPWRIFRHQVRMALRALVLDWMPDAWQVRLVYFKHFHRWPNLSNPQRFTEKIQWRKLHDRNPLLPLYVDKVRSKEAVAAILGEEHVIPTLWSGSNPEDIPFATLKPPYIIKANHGSAMDYFVFKPEDVSNPAAIIRKTKAWLKNDFGHRYREWAYSQIGRQILIEPFIGKGGVSPQDYRFWCFGGKVHLVQIDTDRRFGVQRAFFTPAWKPLPLQMVYPPISDLPKPKVLPEMLRMAEKLSKPFDFVRIDLYDDDGHIYFGEATFYPVAGQPRFNPPSEDFTYGALWQLPA